MRSNQPHGERSIGLSRTSDETTTRPRAADRPAEASVSQRYRYSLISAAIAGALAPAYVIRWHVGPLPTTLLEVTLLLTVAIFAVETLQHTRWWKVLVPGVVLVGLVVSQVPLIRHRIAYELHPPPGKYA